MSADAEVWLVDLDDVELAARARVVLSPEEHEELARLHFPHDRRRRAAARAALRLVAGAALGVAPAEVALARDAHGKPRVAGDPVHLSVSHCGAVGLVACSRAPVGADVEQVRDRHADLAVARRWFAASESAVLAALAADRRAERFAVLWTAKEAVLKALGTGLAGGLDRVVVDAGPAGPALARVGADTAPAARWTLAAVLAPDGHRAAVAVRAPGARIVVARGGVPGLAGLPHG